MEKESSKMSKKYMDSKHQILELESEVLKLE